MSLSQPLNLWSSVSGERFRIRSWSGEECVVYDMFSGDTHLLEPLALELLRCLDVSSPRSTQALLGDLAEVVEAVAPARAQHAVEASLRMIQDIGLVTALAK